MTEIFLAFIADLWIGDPVYALHPARLMGRAIEHAETLLCRFIKNNYVAGLLLAVIFPLSVFGIVSGILYVCYQIHAALAWMVNFLGIYTAIAIHDLRKEATCIHNDLQSGDLVKARESLSRIVGRDTVDLNEEGITRATVETVAESTVDGIIAPLFYAALGGAPLALTYKAVNTLDSMIGHLNRRYREFGFFAAKIDDIFNWLPARFSYFLISLTTIFTKHNVKTALCAGAKELKINNSISSLPEATFAGALQIRLGGTNVYRGRVDRKPYLGKATKALTPSMILESVRLMVSSSWITLFFCLTLNFIGSLDF